MANELGIALDPITGINLPIAAQLYAAAALVQTVTLTEGPAHSGIYANTGTLNLAANAYIVRYIRTDTGSEVGVNLGLFNWSGTQEVNVPTGTSYNSLASANTYFGNRLWTQAWTTATNPNRQIALNSAHDIINRFNYVGIKTGLTRVPQQPQLDEFPRAYIFLEGAVLDSTLIPDDILSAECEIAFALLKGIDPERELLGLRVQSRSFAGVRTTYDPRLIPDNIQNGVPSATAWSLLVPYFDTSNPRNVDIRRVS